MGRAPAPPIQILAKALRANGFKVITPVMPWGQKRMYDVDYPTALAEIESAVRVLRKEGQGASLSPATVLGLMLP
jgi:hypothetical protein